MAAYPNFTDLHWRRHPPMFTVEEADCELAYLLYNDMTGEDAAPTGSIHADYTIDDPIGGKYDSNGI